MAKIKRREPTIIPFNKQLGAFITECRKKLGMSKSELARQLGLSWNQTHFIETGKVENISLKTVDKLTQILMFDCIVPANKKKIRLISRIDKCDF